MNTPPSDFSLWRRVVTRTGFGDAALYKLFSSVLDKSNTLLNINEWLTHLVYSSYNVINVNLCTHGAVDILRKQWSMKATKLHFRTPGYVANLWEILC